MEQFWLRDKEEERDLPDERGLESMKADQLLKPLPLGQADLLTFALDAAIGPLLPLGMLMKAK